MAIDTEDEFTDVYRAHYDDVLRFVRRRAHPMNVDDIVGETFLAAWRRRSELPEDPRPWLFGTARNAMLNAQRGKRRQAAVAVRVMEHSGDDSDDGMTRTEDRLDLIAAWRRAAGRRSRSAGTPCVGGPHGPSRSHGAGVLTCRVRDAAYSLKTPPRQVARAGRPGRTRSDSDALKEQT